MNKPFACEVCQEDVDRRQRGNDTQQRPSPDGQHLHRAADAAAASDEDDVTRRVMSTMKMIKKRQSNRDATVLRRSVSTTSS